MTKRGFRPMKATMRFRRLVLVSCLAWTVPAAAEFADQLTCYQVKDPLVLAGTVDLTSPQLGVAAGCRVSPAKLFCVPAAKSNVAVTNMRTGATITALPVSGPGPALGVLQADPGDRICYKVTCPTPAIGHQSVTDQFGNRTLSNFKVSLMCAPAFAGSARFVDNGNSVTDNYTGLQWEKTTNADGIADYNNPTDADNGYSWSSSGTAADGTVFTDFLSRLNACNSLDGTTMEFAGFAAHCDWRLPTPAELQTIVDPALCDAFHACVDPIFGPTYLGEYWSSATEADNAFKAWVGISYGLGADVRSKGGIPTLVRAVRGPIHGGIYGR